MFFLYPGHYEQVAEGPLDLDDLEDLGAHPPVPLVWQSCLAAVSLPEITF